MRSKLIIQTIIYKNLHKFCVPFTMLDLHGFYPILQNQQFFSKEITVLWWKPWVLFLNPTQFSADADFHRLVNLMNNALIFTIGQPYKRFTSSFDFQKELQNIVVQTDHCSTHFWEGNIRAENQLIRNTHMRHILLTRSFATLRLLTECRLLQGKTVPTDSMIRFNTI